MVKYVLMRVFFITTSFFVATFSFEVFAASPREIFSAIMATPMLEDMREYEALNTRGVVVMPADMGEAEAAAIIEEMGIDGVIMQSNPMFVSYATAQKLLSEGDFLQGLHWISREEYTDQLEGVRRHFLGKSGSFFVTTLKSTAPVIGKTLMTNSLRISDVVGNEEAVGRARSLKDFSYENVIQSLQTLRVGGRGLIIVSAKHNNLEKFIPQEFVFKRVIFFKDKTPYSALFIQKVREGNPTFNIPKHIFVEGYQEPVQAPTFMPSIVKKPAQSEMAPMTTQASPFTPGTTVVEKPKMALRSVQQDSYVPNIARGRPKQPAIEPIPAQVRPFAQGTTVKAKPKVALRPAQQDPSVQDFVKGEPKQFVNMRFVASILRRKPLTSIGNIHGSSIIDERIKIAQAYKPFVIFPPWISLFDYGTYLEAIGVPLVRGVKSKTLANKDFSEGNFLDGFIWIDQEIFKNPYKWDGIRYEYLESNDDNIATLILPDDNFLKENEFKALARELPVAGDKIFGVQAELSFDEGLAILDSGDVDPGVVVVQRYRRIPISPALKKGSLLVRRFLMKIDDTWCSVLVGAKQDYFDV